MAQIVLSFEHYAKLTLPTAKNNLASIDLLSGEMNYAIVIEKRDYRNDGYSVIIFDWIIIGCFES